MADRLNRWFTYTVGFALFPFFVSLIIRGLAEKSSTAEIAKSPEILFMAIIVSSHALGDLTRIKIPETWQIKKWEIIIGIFRSSLLLGALISASLYGTLLYDTIVGPGSISFRIQLFNWSIFLAVLLLLVSTTVEIIIGLMDEENI